MNQTDETSPSPSPSDPRLVAGADSRLLTFLQMAGIDKVLPAPNVTIASSLAERIKHETAIEELYRTMGAPLANGLCDPNTVVVETVAIQGSDRNDILLFIHKPKSAALPCPCLYHMHGGGMAILCAADPQKYEYRSRMAVKTGMVVIGVEFRNSAGVLGPHHFPAGLNDCMSGLEWIGRNKESLGVTKVILTGESGGGNLSIALALKAKRENKLNLVDGVYAHCPFIYGRYDKPSLALPSLQENDGLCLSLIECQILSSLYLPPGEEIEENPLAWPYWASEKELQGLPPHVLSMNELDPLKDEGVQFYRKLITAGVPARARIVLGTTHAAEAICPLIFPDVADELLNDIAFFAKGL